MTLPDALATSVADRYEILRELGEGGMATVWLARDLRHDREVALKVLKPELGVVLGADRFLTEIAVTARLQHPNLLPLFDSGGQDGVLWYVMPYVEGETLRARLDREQQLPVAEAIRLVTAIASALEYAHARGVVHRDLKPENVLLQAGQPVVADFGIALAVRNAGGARVTATGLSLGTPLYMSPEQAAGERAVDARSDVYALGAMAYEMLTGTPPITGPSVPVIMAKLMTEMPAPLTTVRRTIPPHVNDAVLQALEKLPADRFQSAAAFAAALAGTGPVTTRATTAAGDAVRQGRGAGSRALLAGVSAVALVATATAGWLAWRGAGTASATETVGYFSLALPDSTELPPLVSGRHIALSQDGRTTAVLLLRGATRQAWVRRAGEDAFTPVPGSEGATSLALAPDASVLVVTIERDRLVRIPLDGRTAETLVRAESADEWLGTAAVLDAERVVFEQGRSLWIMDGPGRPARRLGGPSADAIALWRPAALPGGTHVLAVALPRDSSATARGTIVAVDVADGTIAETGAVGPMPQYVAPGWLVHGGGPGTLVAQPFSLRTRTVSGTSVTLAERVRTAGSPSYPLFAVADNGWFIWSSGGGGQVWNSRVVRSDARGRLTTLGFPEARYTDPTLSPDGRRLLVGISRDGAQFTTDLHLLDLASGTTARLTDDGGSFRPAWSPDGATVWFMRGPSTRASRVWSMPVDASAPAARRVDRNLVAEVRVGPPGTWNVYRTFGSRDLFIAPSAMPDSLRPLLLTPYNETDITLSPDGRWLAYASDETGATEIFLRPLPGPGGRIAVSAGRGRSPRFDARGALHYLGGENGTHLVRATLSLGAQATVLRRDTLFTLDDRVRGSPFEVLPDGSGFVWLADGSRPASRDQLRVLVGLPAFLTRSGGAPRSP